MWRGNSSVSLMLPFTLLFLPDERSSLFCSSRWQAQSFLSGPPSSTGLLWVIKIRPLSIRVFFFLFTPHQRANGESLEASSRDNYHPSYEGQFPIMFLIFPFPWHAMLYMLSKIWCPPPKSIHPLFRNLISVVWHSSTRVIATTGILAQSEQDVSATFENQIGPHTAFPSVSLIQWWIFYSISK